MQAVVDNICSKNCVVYPLPRSFIVVIRLNLYLLWAFGRVCCFEEFIMKVKQTSRRGIHEWGLYDCNRFMMACIYLL